MTDRKLCSVAECGKPKRANGFCSSHNNRNRRYGDPRGGPRGPRAADGEPLAWFRANQNYDGDDCLIWPYARRFLGYGAIIMEDGRFTSPHREMCAIHNGPPPQGLVARHLCGNGDKGCVSPMHLVWGTVAENCRDMIVHGTSPRGERNPNAKITDDDVREIRRLRGIVRQVDLANRFGISQAAVSKIQLNQGWGGGR